MTALDVIPAGTAEQHVVASPAADFVFTVSTKDERVDCVRVADGEVVRSIVATHPNELALSPDGKILASVQENGRCRIVGTMTKEDRVFSAHSRGIESVAFSANGKTLMTVDWYGYLVFTEVAHGTVLGRIHIPGIDNAQARVLCGENRVAVIRSAKEPQEGAFAGTELSFWKW